MDSKLIYWCVVAVFAAVCLSAGALSLPSGQGHDMQMMPKYQDAENSLDPDERATWLETRDIEEEFKELVNLALIELIKEGRIADITASDKTNSVDKRGRWQGFCFRRTRSGRFLPYICWKGGDEKSGARK